MVPELHVLWEGGAVAAVSTFLVGVAVCFWKPLWVVCALVALLPLDALSSTGVGTYTMPLTVAKLLFPPLLLTVIWRIGVSRQYLRWSAQATLVVVLLGAVAFSALFMEYPESGVHGLRRYVNMALFFFVVLQVVRTPRDAGIVLISFVAATLVSAVAGLQIFRSAGATFYNRTSAAKFTTLQQSQDVYLGRLTGLSLTDPNSYAAFIVVGILAVATYVTLSRAVRRRLAIAASLPFLILALQFTYSRASLVGLGTGLVALVGTVARKKTWAMAGTAGVAAGIMILLATLMPVEFRQRIAALSPAEWAGDMSLQRRVGYHRLGMVLACQSPIIGIGPSNFRHYHSSEDYRYVVDTFQYPREMHNLFLGVLLDAGIVGFIPFVLLLWFSGRALVRACRGDTAQGPIAPAFFVAFVGYLTCISFLGAQFSRLLWLFMALAPVLESGARPAMLHQGRTEALSQSASLQ